MWALIAFIGLGIVVATLIEINERKKAKKKAQEQDQEAKDCTTESCSDCSLLSVCDKEEKNKH